MNERISEEVLREKRDRPPVHPGRVLELEFLEALGMTAYQLAKAIGGPRASTRSYTVSAP